MGFERFYLRLQTEENVRNEVGILWEQRPLAQTKPVHNLILNGASPRTAYPEAN